jgi:hypothetical protein
MRNIDNDIASICGIKGISREVRDEAWRLASTTPNPNVGTAGWRRRWAEQLVERAVEVVAKRDAERTAKREAEAEAQRAKRDADKLAAAKRDANKRAALVAEGEAAGGFGLRDVNPFWYNCGHYPNWVVVVGGDYKTIEDAEAAANRKNAASSASWHAFLNA